MPFDFNNSYVRLPSHFYALQSPVAVAGPRLVKLNQALAVELGLDPDRLSSPDGLAVLAGNAVPEGAEPLAMAYAGHQFGGFAPQLGDGRAILLGEILDPQSQRYDIQLKGSGRTAFSRAGDGRAWLGPVLREYIIGEAMHALGIPTTRALAAVATGETVYREADYPGAILTRVARSHVRIGTYQYFSARGDIEAIRRLSDYMIARHYPEAAAAEKPYRALLDTVVTQQVHLVAQWLGVGFIHGVMNTDNTSIVGETIDYGPCAFMDSYHPGTVYSSIDHGGRYAYGNQPRIAHWNLSHFAESLLPLIDEDRDRAVEEAQAAIDAFPQKFEQAYLERFRAKLGLREVHPNDSDLIESLLKTMAETGAEFTNSFRALCRAAEGAENDIRSELSA
ncbi:MAG: YdiU family protein, partial [Thiohalocapsa sp.]